MRVRHLNKRSRTVCLSLGLLLVAISVTGEQFVQPEIMATTELTRHDSAPERPTLQRVDACTKAS